MEFFSADLILFHYNRIKNGNCGEFFSNYFFLPLAKNISGGYSEKSIFFLNKNGDFDMLYFVSSDLEDLDNLIRKELPLNIDLCIDYICKGAMPVQVESLYKRHFKKYSIFQKMILRKLPTISGNDMPKKSIVSAKCIYYDILQTFDKYNSYFPPFSKIEEAIAKNFIVTVGDEADFKGYILFDIKGSQAYINFIANRGGKESLVELWKRFYGAIQKSGAKTVWLWVDVENTRALRMYDIEGFQKDSLFNYIYKLPRQ